MGLGQEVELFEMVKSLGLLGCSSIYPYKDGS
jgi:hypothetical protein